MIPQIPFTASPRGVPFQISKKSHFPRAIPYTFEKKENFQRIHGKMRKKTISNQNKLNKIDLNLFLIDLMDSLLVPNQLWFAEGSVSHNSM